MTLPCSDRLGEAEAEADVAGGAERDCAAPDDDGVVRDGAPVPPHPAARAATHTAPTSSARARAPGAADDDLTRTTLTTLPL
ncbi:hypothetical protein [Sanguibacter sp. A246]|uniref:hypothetical protein n=1 Tax=Sanguibacter sp. A246 TaxID=3457326 RepID=UPI003FD8BC77